MPVVFISHLLLHLDIVYSNLIIIIIISPIIINNNNGRESQQIGANKMLFG